VLKVEKLEREEIQTARSAERLKAVNAMFATTFRDEMIWTYE